MSWMKTVTEERRANGEISYPAPYATEGKEWWEGEPGVTLRLGGGVGVTQHYARPFSQVGIVK